jgi:putative proteasome-type protease
MSNPGVGPPIEPLVHRAGALACNQVVCIEEHSPCCRMIHTTWGHRLREVFEGIGEPRRDGGDTRHPLLSPLQRYEPLRKITHPGERIV